MKLFVRTGIAAACGALIAVSGAIQPGSAQQQQQQPAATTAPQTPVQPGPGMGREMMHGPGMGPGMAQPGTGSNAGQCCSGQQMTHMGEQMRTMGRKMMGGHTTTQEQQQMGRQMMDMGQQMENMGHQMPAEHGAMQMPSQTTAPAAPAAPNQSTAPTR
jgi:hypothetical protein